MAEVVQSVVGRPSAVPPIPESARPVAELTRRPSRPPDYAAENRALITLAQVMATAPESILQKLADTALSMCRADSAGVSLLTADRERFFWPAVVGRWSPHVGGGTPRDFGPCGVVLDLNVPLLFSHPERDFPYFGEVQPALEDALLIPFYVGGEAVGTIWVVAHDEGHHFDTEDLRLMSNLATFASAAYQALAARNATQRIASIVETSDDAIISKDLNGVITSWNKGAERIFGYTAEEVIGKPVTILIPTTRHNEEPEILARIRSGDRIDHYETVRQRKDGSLVDISLTVSPMKNAEGIIVGASKIARDISERKRSDAQIAILAREAEHRAKNVLATVQATVYLSQADTPEGLKQAIAGRIQALADVHNLFVQSRWTGADLRNLVRQEIAPYCRDGDARVRIDGAELLLEPNVAQTVAVTLHELATNAAKYGALSVPVGRVDVAWSRAGDGKLVLRWSETGGPPVAPPTRRGFGTRVMENMIQQLNGDMRFDWRREGLLCEIAVP